MPDWRMRIDAALVAFVLLAPAGPAAGAAPITIENEAAVPPVELDSIRADFDRWYARVYAYHRAAPAPVTLKLTLDVPFGFYRDGTVLLPPGKDRLAMVEDWVHELTHHVTGRDSSFFFREGTATHTVDALFAQDGRVPQGWPYFGKTCDQWVALFAARGKLPPLDEMLAWPRYQGATPEQDFRSWQIYLAGGSFVGWYLSRHGHPAFRKAFLAEWPKADSADAGRDWQAWVAARAPQTFDAAAVLPRSKRYRNYAERLK